MEIGSNTYNNFLLSIPKKQAKSYEIDLGQNNGAYDEELLIRYGDNTLNHMKNKNRGGNLNMDDIMKMNEQLRPFQERQPPEEGVLSLGQICEGIEEKIGNIDDSAEFLVEFEKNLNKAIEVMTNDIFKFFDDTYNEFNPKLLEKYSYLKTKIKEQKDENANLLKQIDFLLQENTKDLNLLNLNLNNNLNSNGNNNNNNNNNINNHMNSPQLQIKNLSSEKTFSIPELKSKDKEVVYYSLYKLHNLELNEEKDKEKEKELNEKLEKEKK